MKYTTANTKNPNYDAEHILYIGTHTGTFKRIDISQENAFRENQLEEVKNLEKKDGVTSMNWSNLMEKNEILLGRENGVVKVFDLPSNRCKDSWTVDGKVVGVCKFDEKYICAVDSGQIYFLKNTELDPSDTLSLSGDNITRMRQCQEQPHLIATGGKERKNNLKVIDLTNKTVTFTTKNIPNDELDLEVPVWDTDFTFLSSNSIATCSRYGYVRIYDIKKQRRPILNYKNDKEQISYTCMTHHENLIFCGSNLGNLRAFDVRSMKTHVHTYKGFAGSVTSLALDTTGKYLLAGGLDRYVRVYDVESSVMLYQCYVKSKAMQVLLQDIKEESEIVVQHEEVKRTQQLESDPEYDDLFDNMQTVEDDEEEMIKRKKEQPETKRRKKVKKST